MDGLTRISKISKDVVVLTSDAVRFHFDQKDKNHLVLSRSSSHSNSLTTQNSSSKQPTMDQLKMNQIRSLINKNLKQDSFFIDEKVNQNVKVSPQLKFYCITNLSDSNQLDSIQTEQAEINPPLKQVKSYKFIKKKRSKFQIDHYFNNI
jgi:hypothetical protein